MPLNCKTNLLTGSPDATASLDEQTYYTSGVTMGSLVLAMESVAMALYSPFIHALSTKFGKQFCQLLRSPSFCNIFIVCNINI